MSSPIDQLKALAAEAAASVGPPGYGAKIEGATQTLSALILQIAKAYELPIPAMAPIMSCVIGNMIRRGLPPDQRAGLVETMMDIITNFAAGSEADQ